MHQPTPSRSPHSPCHSASAPGARTGGKATRLIIIAAQLLAVAIISSLTVRAQLVVDGSYENINPTVAMAGGFAPNWSYSGPYPYLFPGQSSWYTYLASPDIFWSTTYVPNNFMTAWASPLYPFHGRNYAGISTGRFYGVFGSEVLVGTLSPPATAGNYNVHARFAIGTARNQPSFIKVSLISSTGLSPDLTVGYQLVSTAAWNLFSQAITLTGSANYDRIRIEGVDSLPNNWGAYCFIDSVDVDRASTNPCDFLKASVKYDPSSSKGCCWDLVIDNTLPTWMGQLYGIKLTAVAPNFLSGPATNGPGWTSVTAMPTTVGWKQTTGGPVPIGTGQLVGNYCITPSTSPQMQIIEFLAKDGKVLCRDTVFTDCPVEPPHPCMEFSTPQVTCGPVVNGQQTYNVVFTMSVYNPVPGSQVDISASPYGTVSPSTFYMPPYSQTVSLTFTDTPPVDGHICLYFLHHKKGHGIDSIICRDSLCFNLPKCAEDCCKDFLKSFGHVAIGISNGNVSISGCVTAGPNPIKRFSATIVAAQLRTKCLGPAGAWTRIFGDIVSGSLGAALGPPQYVPTMAFSREVVWGGPAYTNCVPFSPCVPFSLKMIFPNPPTSPLCRDTLRFAVRYSFTDCKCLTCDTIIYYQIVRKYKPIIWDGGGVDHTDFPGGIDGTGHVKPNPGLLNITMSSDSRGTLSVTLPSAGDDDPHIRIVGMQLRPEGTTITGLSQQGTSNRASISDNLADISYTLDEGNTALFDLSYLNGNGDREIRNLMVFRYIELGDSTGDSDSVDVSDTLEVYATTPGGGGDVVERTESSVHDVRTYALHVVASNGLNAAVEALKLHVNGDATLIAVGPVGDGTNAVLTPGSDNNGNTVVQVDKNTWTVQNVDAGETLDPIYLTFAGVGDNAVSVDYATMDATGAAISTGTADISSPLRVAGVERESAELGAAMMPIYPNPSAQSATVEFDLHSAGRVSVSVQDIRGANILRLIDGRQLDAGEHLLPIDTRALPAGTYVVVLDVDGRVFTRPMTIVR